MTGADVLLHTLESHGVDVVFTLCGNGLDPFYAACQRAGVRVVDFHNEQAAAYAADAYARLTRKLGVCAVSSGVAHINGLTGIVNAYYDGAPLLLISGSSDSAFTDMGKFQDLDQVALAEPVCKYARLVDRVEKMAFYADEACSFALSGRPGPVHLTVTVDVLEAPGAQTDWPERTSQDVAGQLALGMPQAVRMAADLLRKAKRPVLVAGSGVYYAGAERELERLSNLTRIPVVVPIWDRGAIDKPLDSFMGVVGAASGGPALLPDADVVLLVGTHVDYRVGYGLPPTIKPGARIVRIDVEPGELQQGIGPDVAILGDARSVLDQLGDELEKKGGASFAFWEREARQRDRAFRESWVTVPAWASPPLTGRHVVDALRPFLTDDLLFLVDGGNIGQWAHMALCDRYPGHWLTCGASGVVGWGLPGAIGAKLAFPGRPALLLSGDGAFGFTVAELETAVRHETPFVIVLADDQAWGIVVSGQQKRGGETAVSASRLGPIRYDVVAEGFGARGVRVETASELTEAIRRGLASNIVTLIHVPVALGGPTDPQCR